MRRREFITFIGSLAGWPLLVHAQQFDQKRLIGVLMVDAENDPEGRAHAKAFRDALQELGWMADRNVRIEYRWAAGDASRIRGFAKELVEMRPDVILARSTPATAALKAETRAIPIVFTTVSDPIGGGFVESFARPGANITGFTNFESSIGGKWLGLLKEISPRVGRVAVMFNPEMAPYAPYYVHPWKRLLDYSRWNRSRALFATTQQSSVSSRPWPTIRMAD
jgi:putative ABC transport system substrate-binding protein